MLEQKFDRLTEILSGYGSLVVAYSGGLDSGFLLWAAFQTLGQGKVLAVTGDSPSYASGEKEEAISFARQIGLEDKFIRVIKTEEIEREGYRANDFDRCFHCKTELFEKLGEIAQEAKFAYMADGFNASDKSDFRPGHKAGQEHGVVSPLAEAGLEKEDIIALAEKNNLSLADKPASACLSSRIPFGVRITPENLNQVDRAEHGLKQLGLRGFRVRHHGEIARLELNPDDIGRIVANGMKEKVVACVKQAGFKFVALDLEGYRMGSFNPEKYEV